MHGERWKNDWAADAYVADDFGGEDSVVDLTNGARIGDEGRGSTARRTQNRSNGAGPPKVGIVRSGTGSGQVVVVRGTFDGRPSEASWNAGVLIAEPELARRAGIVVALGEEFSDEGTESGVRASLDSDHPLPSDAR